MGEGLLRTAEPKDGRDFQPPKIKLKRLTRKEEVQKVFQKGKKWISTSFVIFSLESDVPDLFYAIHTRKKLGPAVERNRIKRIYREVLRQRKTLLRGYTLIVIPRTGSRAITLRQLADQIDHVFLENLRRK